jgi:hypothetical protein
VFPSIDVIICLNRVVNSGIVSLLIFLIPSNSDSIAFSSLPVNNLNVKDTLDVGNV